MKAKMRSKTLTIMFTDMKGYVGQTASHSRQQLEKLLKLQDKAILPIIEKHGGRLVKTMGDAYMVVFESPTSAVLCGQEIQAAVTGHFKLRIGINTGEVNLRRGDVFGEPVNLASRLESATQPGKVFLTEAVYLAMNRNEVPTVFVGSETFRGIPREVKIYQIGELSFWDKMKNLWPKKHLGTLALGGIILGLLAINWSTYRWKIASGGTKFNLGQFKTNGSVLSSEALESDQKETSDLPDGDFFEISAPAIESGLFNLERLTPTPSLTPTPTETPTPTPSPGKDEDKEDEEARPRKRKPKES